MPNKGRIKIEAKLSTGESCEVDFDAKETLAKAIIAFGEEAIYDLYLAGIKRRLYAIIQNLGKPPCPLPASKIQEHIQHNWKPGRNAVSKNQAKREYIAELMAERMPSEEERAALVGQYLDEEQETFE